MFDFGSTFQNSKYNQNSKKKLKTIRRRLDKFQVSKKDEKIAIFPSKKIKNEIRRKNSLQLV